MVRVIKCYIHEIWQELQQDRIRAIMYGSGDQMLYPRNLAGKISFIIIFSVQINSSIALQYPIIKFKALL
jgi:hypothetical protein